MSRLRRPFLYDRRIFVTVKLLSSRAKLGKRDYERLAIALARGLTPFGPTKGAKIPVILANILTLLQGHHLGCLRAGQAQPYKTCWVAAPPRCPARSCR
jgi:hypothetical protein